MGLSLSNTTVCPSEKQFTTMKSEFKKGSRELTAICSVYRPYDQVHSSPTGLISDGHRWALPGDHESNPEACYLAGSSYPVQPPAQQVC